MDLSGLPYEARVIAEGDERDERILSGDADELYRRDYRIDSGADDFRRFRLATETDYRPKPDYRGVRRLADEVREYLASAEFAESFEYAPILRETPVSALIARNRDERGLFR